MKNLLFILSLLILTIKVLFGQEPVVGKIVDEKGEGIPFASIGVLEKNYGAITFEDGSFSLVPEAKYIEDSLTISAIGFERSKISYREFSAKKDLIIGLKEDIQYLNEITITPGKLRFQKIGIKKKGSPNNFVLSSPLDGASVVMLFDEIAESILLDEISVTVGKINVDSIQLRCRIYAVDKETGLPGEDLLQDNLIQTITEKVQRLTFFPSRDLWVDEPVFIGFEWVMTKSQFKRLQNAQNAYPLSFIDDIVAANPGFSWNMNENKRILFRDTENNIVKRVSLSKEQSEVLNKKDAEAPRLQFKIKMKGSKTYYGSSIANRWSRIPHEALVSVKIGTSKEMSSDVADDDLLSFMGKEIHKKEINEYLNKYMPLYEINGVSLALFNESGIVYHQVKGLAEAETEIEVTPETIFEAASLSKPFFAYMVMKYVDLGLIDLDKPLYKYLPYADIEHDERYKKITARMVLSHTTGFPNWRTDHDGELFISFDPGTKYQYSGEGYQYLAKVLAHLLETDLVGLEKNYQELIAKPMGLKVTKFVQDANNLKNKAAPYKKGKKLDNTYEEEFGAAYSVHSESQDFAKWLIALLNKEGLSSEGYRELFNEQIRLPEDSTNLDASAWTLGFAKYEFADAVYYGHGGNNFGYSSGFFIDQKNKVGAVMFTNADQVSDFIVDFFLFLIEYD